MQPGAQHLSVLVLVSILWTVMAEESQVHWISPSAGDVFGPGDNIKGAWTADKAVVSPSFKLCQGSTQSSLNTRDASDGSGAKCGAKTYPTVQQDSGTYSISLTVPNTTHVEWYYLLMMDDFGNVHRSPSFSLSPSGSVPEPSERGGQNRPLGTQESSQSPLSNNPKAEEAPAEPLVTVTSLPVPSAAMASAVGTEMTATRHSSPPTAAFAIPLSIVGAILLAALIVAVRQNRILGAERALDIHRFREALSRSSSFGKGGYRSKHDDIEKNRAGAYGCAPMMPAIQAMPVPLFMPPAPPYELRASRAKDSYTAHVSRPYSPPPSLYKSAAPSYRSSSRPASTHSRISVSSSHHSTASSRSRTVTFREPEIPMPLPRPPSRVSSFSSASRSSTYRSLVALPPIQAGPAFYDMNRLETKEPEGVDGDVTDSILEDYMLPSPSRPSCLLPAPHLREEESAQKPTLVNPYDAVAASLRNSRISSTKV
ncbi:hypothetical protein VNI00_012166 [Paramarasmius palmivorus]|uniref:Uncharacterized protein n=1 Tax=Paramarasmius palmivorus TaxID=297713 RepID=A0AAW0C5Z4_9AGAR